MHAMNARFLIVCASALIGLGMAGTAPARADTVVDVDRATGGGGKELPPYLQCVPYARQVSGIQIRGDAWTWWTQAEGQYARGFMPKVGAVMALRPHGKMELGHVAAVSRIVDSRTVLLRHSNWSLINGRRGQIEDNVRAIDVSPKNDWSEVRVWFAPLEGLGATRWPVQGFIYPTRIGPGKAGSARMTLARNASDANTLDVADPIAAIISSRLASTSQATKTRLASRR